MALTDNCSIFGAVDERGINLVVRHIMRQRPSLFNYGTGLFLKRPDLMCEKIEASPDVLIRGNPLFTLEDPLPILGTDGRVGVHFCLQMTKAEVDFHPGSVFALPPELNPPLKPQRFAFHIQVCAGLGCPSQRFLDGVDVVGPPIRSIDTHSLRTVAHKSPNLHDVDQTQVDRNEKELRGELPDPKRPPIPIPTDKVDCFCLDLFAVGHFEIQGSKGAQQYLIGKLDGLEIVDIEPKGLENSAECYLKLLIQFVVLPRMRVALEKLVFEILDGLATVTVFATPISPKVPFNPAIEDNKLKVFINVEVS